MEGSGETGTAMQRPNSAFGFGASQMGGGVLPMRSLSPSLSPDNSKRPGIPPSHPNNPLHSLPYSKVSTGIRSGNWQSSPQNSSLGYGPSHTRSLSQPSFFNLDCLPPLSPSAHREASPSSLSDPVSNEISMEENVVNSHVPSLPSPVNRSSLPPRKGHRRSNSDILLGFNAMIQSSPQLIPISSRGVLDGSASGRENPVQLAKQGQNKDRDGNGNANGIGEKKFEGEVVDDLFSAYMNLEHIDKVNSSGTEDKDFDSRVSAKSNGCESSDNEVESNMNGNLKEKREGVKRRAGGDIAPTARHYRSLSMDSYMESFQLDDESLKILPSGAGQQSPSGLLDGNSSKFSMEFGNGDFSAAELKKIMESEKLTEIALSDPKRAKRILANRQSAARSKERRSRYISELEHKVQTLQTEATTLSAQVTKLQRDSVGLTSQNNELKFRLQAMEQQAQLKDALNEALSAEVQRLKLAAADLGGEAHLSNCMAQQLSLNQQMFHLQHQQQVLYQLQQQQQQQQQQAQPQQPLHSQHNEMSSQQHNGKVAGHESNQ
ncbi:putative transcription factor PosF21 [Morus notabilis]|uniref:Putative transcription factor PosF21 n=1 Tax=Morus notabilis TaxID=981085 RepID=W9SFG5_9ROSA|nr:transcription factor RF2a [Morus notabilis]XP_024027168.1 transcription factor RF2a [Morus notabilis]EXC04193.1 putative transcription factor PosF21 [Morus notabilis]